jgi:hypothetical protein
MAYSSPSRTLAFTWHRQPAPGLPPERTSTYGSGREALFALARHLGPVGTVLLPVWVPEGVYQPFLLAGWTILYYPTDQTGAPKTEALAATLQEQPVHLLVLIHYFGQRQPTEAILNLLPPATALLEDWAHTYPTPTWPAPRGRHWALFSPNKLAGITDGAWLVGPTILPYSDSPATRQRVHYVAWRLVYLLATTLVAHTAFLRGFCLRVTGFAYHKSYQLLLHHTAQPGPVSGVGRWMIKHLPHHELVERRIEQATYYHSHLNQPRLRSLLREVPLDHPLIGYPVWVEDRAHFEAYLAQHQIRGQAFTDSWWFVANGEAEKFAESQALLAHHFLLPINQNLGIGAVAAVVRVVNGYGGPAE